jgi:dolichyl-phosphate beta-glucosyltransferase
MRVSIVIPCLNEALRLPPSLRKIFDYLDRESHWLPAEVIVVDDGSTDETAAAARAVPMPQEVSLTVIEHARNRGKGAAVRTGFQRSRGAWVLLSDADLASPIDQIEELSSVARDSRVVFGSRALDRRLITVRQPLYRDLMGRMFNLAVQVLALPGVHDTQCGFKLFPGDLARALARVQQIDGFAFDVELLTVARHWGFEIAEVPVRWRHVEASRVSAVRHSSEMFRDIVRLGFRRLVGRLPQPPDEPRSGG